MPTPAARFPRPQRTATDRTTRAAGQYWRLERARPEDRGSWVQIADHSEKRQAAAEYWGPRLALGLAVASVLLWGAAAVAGAFQAAAAIPLAYGGDAAMAFAVITGFVGYAWSGHEHDQAIANQVDQWPEYRPDAVDEITRRLQVAS